MANQGQISPAKRILKLHQLWEQDLGDSRQSRDGCLMARNLANFPRWNYVFNPQNLDEKIWTYESITNFVDDFRVSLFCWRNHFERNLHFFVYCTYCIIIQFLWESTASERARTNCGSEKRHHPSTSDTGSCKTKHDQAKLTKSLVAFPQ